jgi:peptidoglycan/LPS O-acetylase OafA/YrhL
METGRRVNEIDLLRFLAALAVVFHHYAFRGHAADNLTFRCRIPRSCQLRSTATLASICSS